MGPFCLSISEITESMSYVLMSSKLWRIELLIPACIFFLLALCMFLLASVCSSHIHYHFVFWSNCIVLKLQLLGSLLENGILDSVNFLHYSRVYMCVCQSFMNIQQWYYCGVVPTRRLVSKWFQIVHSTQCKECRYK